MRGAVSARAEHILSIVDSLAGGGVERALLRLAGGWAAAGRRVTIACVDPTGPLAAEWPAGVRQVRLANRWRLPDLVRVESPDLLFCAGSHYTSIAAWTRWRLGRRCPPIVGKLSNAVHRGDHGPLLDMGHRRWLALHGRFLDRLVAMTPASAAEAVAACRMAGRVSVIPNPPARPIPGAPPPPLPPGRFVLGVGRLAPQKRWDRLIDALPLLADRDVGLVILGEGPRRAALQAQAERLGVGGRVDLPGHAVDPLPAMARATVVALTSAFEGTPGVLGESLSVGTPVVATEASPAVREIVREEAWGTIVAPDPPAIARALDRWLDPAARRPDPVPPPGADSAERYLALFDALVSGG